ncbi:MULTISPECIES: response regulator [Croceitalea]|uniref:Response regulator n=1 Tax=Croceitalea vernalis TaxID=3075599 RepID=A0ABU3BDX1_9FLAO|nr:MULTISPECIES: response regulator [unclassified Croceitalea]MDT0538648.1 response regulator [Croceitalea sp. P059]MDT0620432.1 response regulator [Croceitalea sp. P007]
MSKQLFLVDDDEIFRTAATVLLGLNLPEYETVQFENGLSVYEKLIDLVETAELLPELLLLDINMPVMNGWELLEELKSAPAQIRQKVNIQILTSSIAPEDLNLSKTYEFINGYVTKPLTTSDIENLKNTLS